MMNSKIYHANNELLVANAMPVVTRRTTTTTTQPTSYPVSAYDDYGVSTLYSGYFDFLFLFFVCLVIFYVVIALVCGIFVIVIFQDKSKKCKICGTKIVAKNNKFPQNCPKCGATLN